MLPVFYELPMQTAKSGWFLKKMSDLLRKYCMEMEQNPFSGIKNSFLFYVNVQMRNIFRFWTKISPCRQKSVFWSVLSDNPNPDNERISPPTFFMKPVEKVTFMSYNKKDFFRSRRCMMRRVMNGSSRQRLRKMSDTIMTGTIFKNWNLNKAEYGKTASFWLYGAR